MSSSFLSPRYNNDGNSIRSLNDTQAKTKRHIEKKVEEGKYNFIEVVCPVCGNSDDFENLSEKDRYGLYHPVKACRVCGLVQTNPRMTRESYEEFYDSEYRLLYNGEESYAESQFAVQKKRAKEIYEYLDNTTPNQIAGADVLDIGCGPGGTLAYFQDKEHRVVGCDLDSDAVAYGKKEGIPLRKGTVEDLDINWQPDVVILSHIVEHFLDPVDDLEELQNLIHDDSIIYVELPGIKWLSPFRKYYEADFLRQLQNAHTYYFTAKSLKNLMAQSGFKPIDIDESIQSIFTPSENNIDYGIDSDYPDVIKHLHRVEKWHRWGISPIPSPHDLYTHPTIIHYLKKSGLYPFAKKVYYRVH